MMKRKSPEKDSIKPKSNALELPLKKSKKEVERIFNYADDDDGAECFMCDEYINGKHIQLPIPRHILNDSPFGNPNQPTSELFHPDKNKWDHGDFCSSSCAKEWAEELKIPLSKLSKYRTKFQRVNWMCL